MCVWEPEGTRVYFCHVCARECVHNNCAGVSLQAALSVRRPVRTREQGPRSCILQQRYWEHLMSTLRPLPTSAAVFRGESSRRLHLPLRAAARVGCAGGGGTLPAQTTRGRGLADYPAPHAAHISGATLGAPHPSSAGRRHLAPRRVQSPRPQRGRADQRARVQVPPPIQAGDGPGLDPETDPGPAQADCVSRFTPAALNRCLAVAAGGRRRAWRTRRRRRLDTDCWRGRGRGIGPDRGPFRRPREWQGSSEGHRRAPAGPKVTVMGRPTGSAPP